MANKNTGLPNKTETLELKHRSGSSYSVVPHPEHFLLEIKVCCSDWDANFRDYTVELGKHSLHEVHRLGDGHSKPLGVEVHTL